MTLNFLGIEPPLERRLALAVRQLRAISPDVVCLQEVIPLDGVSGRTTADAIAGELGLAAHYAVSVEAEHEGLAVLAKTIAETRVLALPVPPDADPCILLSAKIATDGGALWVHTTHLHHRLDAGVTRERQVLAIDEAIRSLGRGSDDPPQILCGDMNAVPESDEMRFLRGLATLAGRSTHFQDAWLCVHREPVRGEGPAEGFTWSTQNALARRLPHLDIDRRIDYVYVTSRKKDDCGTVHDCRVVLTDEDGGDGIRASDHYGVMADVQIVPRS